MGQTLPANFANYSLPDGLPDNNINAIAQDKYGYIWLGTANGLVRFDGKNFTSFSGASSFGSLPSNEILSIQAYGQNELLIVTRHGLFILNVSNMKGAAFMVPPRLGEKMVNVNKLRGVVVCADMSFIIIAWSGIYHFSKNKQLIFRYDDYAASDNRGRGFGPYFVMPDDNTLIVAGQQKTIVYNIAAKSIKTTETSDAPVLTLNVLRKYGNHKDCHFLQITRGKMLALPYNTNSLLYLDESKKKIIEAKLPVDSVRKWFTWRSIVYPLNDSVLLLTGKFKGVYKLMLNRQQTTLTLDTNASFRDYKCNVVFRDFNQKLWMGFANGLKMEKHSPVNLQLHATAGLYESEVNRTPVIQVSVSEKYIYTASQTSGGAYRFYKNSLEFDRLIPFSFPPFGNKSLHAAAYWKGDILLFGTDCGLFMYSEKTAKSKFVNLPNWNPRYNWVADIYIDKKGNAWITVNKQKGCYIWKKDEPLPVWFDFGKELPSKVMEIYHVTEDNEGNIWFTGDGISRYNTRLQKTDYHKDNFSDDETISNGVSALISDNKGNMWLAGGRTGVVVLHPASGVVKIFGKKDGLADDEASDIRYHMGFIWVLCKNGISKIDCSTQKISSVSNLKDVYYKQYFSNKLSFDSATGSFYTGAGTSVIRFQPGYVALKQQLPKLLLVYAKDGRDSTIWFPDKPLKVKWKDRNITLFVNAINYEDAESHRYAYRIENGTTTGWIAMDEQRRINLTGLKSGKTSIEVKVFSPQHNWPDQFLTYEIKVITPFWRTAWFRILCLFAALGIAFIIYKYRKRQSGKLIKMKDNISKDLHDEIGSTLSGIAMYSHMVKNNLVNNEKEAAMASASIIQQSAAEMVTKLNDIVWLIKPQNETLEILADKLRLYTIDMCGTKNIQPVISISDNATAVKPSLQTRKNIYLLCKEAINNAVKYSNASTLTINFSIKDNLLKIIIADNGNGFDAANIKKGNGLENMQQRANEIKARLAIDSAPGKGCTITIGIKIPQKGIV